MNIGLTYTLRQSVAPGAPDDAEEEFDSPETVAAVARVLQGLGHTTIELGDGPALLTKLQTIRPDFVFNFAEGRGAGRSRESRVPAVLEMLDIPYTGADPGSLAVCLDKDWARRMVESVGVHTPKALTIAFGSEMPDDLTKLGNVLEEAHLEPPLIAKPVFEGSSKGIRNKCLIESADQFGPIVAELWQTYRQPVLVEEFIDGEELTVAVLGSDEPEVLGVMRVVPRKKSNRFIYSLEVKRDYMNQVDYECPAQISDEEMEAVEEAALLAYDILAIRDVARIDFRLRDGEPYFIEANPLPGLNPVTGDIVLIARGMGMTHEQLIERILNSAMERHGMRPS